MEHCTPGKPGLQKLELTDRVIVPLVELTSTRNPWNKKKKREKEEVIRNIYKREYYQYIYLCVRMSGGETVPERLEPAEGTVNNGVTAI